MTLEEAARQDGISDALAGRKKSSRWQYYDEGSKPYVAYSDGYDEAERNCSASHSWAWVNRLASWVIRWFKKDERE